MSLCYLFLSWRWRFALKKSFFYSPILKLKHSASSSFCICNSASNLVFLKWLFLIFWLMCVPSSKETFITQSQCIVGVLNYKQLDLSTTWYITFDPCSIFSCYFFLFVQDWPCNYRRRFSHGFLKFQIEKKAEELTTWWLLISISCQSTNLKTRDLRYDLF